MNAGMRFGVPGTRVNVFLIAAVGIIVAGMEARLVFDIHLHVIACPWAHFEIKIGNAGGQ